MTDWAIEGSIAERDGQWKLIGGRCLDCGALAFPPPKVCAGCWSETIEPAELSTVGDLYTYTVVHIGRPGWRSPYAIGYTKSMPGRASPIFTGLNKYSFLLIMSSICSSERLALIRSFSLSKLII